MPEDRLPIDLSRSIPPLVPHVEAALRDAFAELSRSGADLGAEIRTAPFAGSQTDRSLAAGLLTTRWHTRVDPSALVVGSGTQNLLSLLLEELVGQNGILLAERLTYSMLPALATRAGVKLHGVEIDAEGLVPKALDDACSRHRPKAIFCNPTVHNPTTSIMSLARRREIVAIAQSHGVAIIEDDVLGFLHPDAPPPLAALAPGVTWYLMGLTKCVAHGMRIAYLAAPDARAAAEMVARHQALSSWSASPIALLVLRQLASGGHLQAIFDGIRTEAAERQTIAVELLKRAQIQRETASLHIWLTLPPGLCRHAFVDDVGSRGVRIRSADRFSVDHVETPDAVRLSLSSPLTRRELQDGLSAVADVLRTAHF